jgi:hypothetical protein
MDVAAFAVAWIENAEDRHFLKSSADQEIKN